MQEDNSNAPEEQKTSVESPVEEHSITEVPASQFASGQPKKSKKKIVIVAVLLAVVIIAGGAFYYVKNKEKPTPTNTQTSTLPTQAKPEVKQEEVDAALAKFITPTTGETWLASPKKLGNQNFFKNPQDYGDEIEYYEVGKRAGNTLLISITQQIGDDILLYEKSPAGAVTLASRPDGDAVYNDDNEKGYAEALNSAIAINKDIHYDSLTIPRELDLDKKYKLGKPVYPSLGSLIRPDTTGNAPKVTEVKKLGSSSLKKTEGSYADTKLTSIGYHLQTPFQTTIQLTYEPLEADLQKYQWQTGTPSEDKLHAISRGCGGRFSSVTRSDVLTDADVQQVGKSPSGQAVYELKDSNSILLNKAYDEFKEFNSVSPDVPYANISKAEFIKQHAVVLHKDKYNQWLVYVRDQLAPGYGCAKPVVYLYPTKQQNVSVRVGADVKISEPLYDPSTGWKNVLANPGGSLVVNGKAYDSLFWEGPGVGAYPSINSGTVVRTSEAKAVIRSQLKQLGLNNKEISDFEVYWQDKLPSKPYTRLTWLTTAELNQLAPLYITPKPDTVIRVFLDYAGLDAPIKLAPQKLTSIPRKGFTVVEWGGLSPLRLY